MLWPFFALLPVLKRGWKAPKQNYVKSVLLLSDIIILRLHC